MHDSLTTAQVAEFFGVSVTGAKNIAQARGWRWETGARGACLWSRADVEAEQARRRVKAELQAGRPPTKKYPGRHQAPSADSFNRDGAERLAVRIREYWARRGKRVEVRVESNYTGYAPAMRGADWYVVRSDLVNGWPRK